MADLVSEAVSSCAVWIHRRLGPGLLPHAYTAILAREVRRRGLRAVTDVEVPLELDGGRLDSAFRLDLVVENRLLVDVVVADEVSPLHVARLQTHLRLSRFPSALLVNFGVLRIAEGLVQLEDASLAEHRVSTA